jgi:hypothetical protein
MYMYLIYNIRIYFPYQMSHAEINISQKSTAKQIKYFSYTFRNTRTRSFDRITDTMGWRMNREHTLAI